MSTFNQQQEAAPGARSAQGAAAADGCSPGPPTSKQTWSWIGPSAWRGRRPSCSRSWRRRRRKPRRPPPRGALGLPCSCAPAAPSLPLSRAHLQAATQRLPALPPLQEPAPARAPRPAAARAAPDAPGRRPGGRGQAGGGQGAPLLGACGGSAALSLPPCAAAAAAACPFWCPSVTLRCPACRRRSTWRGSRCSWRVRGLCCGC